MNKDGWKEEFLMAKRKINRTKLQELEKFLQSEGFEPYRMNNNQGFDFISSEGGKIQVFDTGAVVIQASPARKEVLEEYWEQNCKFAEDGSEPRPANLCYAYFVQNDKRGIIKTQLEQFGQKQGFPLRATNDPNSMYQFTVTDGENNISITQYRTGKLVLRGKHSILWEKVTELISQSIGLVINTMVANVVYNQAFAAVVNNSGNEIEITNIVTSEDQTRAEEWIKNRLKDCYDFLYENDRNRVESSETLLLIEAPLKDYFGCVSGTMEALEGFIKKILIEIGAFTEREIISKQPKWEFNEVIDPISKVVTAKVRQALSSEPGLRSRQETIIQDLVGKYWIYRNPHFHSGPPNGGKPIPTLEKARSLHDEIVSLMKKAYDTLHSEIKR